MDTPTRVHMVLCQIEPCFDGAFRRRVDFDIRQEEVVNGGVGQIVGHEALNMSFDLIVLCHGRCNSWKNKSKSMGCQRLPHEKDSDYADVGGHGLNG